MNFRQSVIIADLRLPEVTRHWKNSNFSHFWKNDP